MSWTKSGECSLAVFKAVAVLFDTVAIAGQSDRVCRSGWSRLSFRTIAVGIRGAVAVYDDRRCCLGVEMHFSSPA